MNIIADTVRCMLWGKNPGNGFSVGNGDGFPWGRQAEGGRSDGRRNSAD